ncbi:hypothetical protein ACFLTP_03545, partial [Chloroflexota bacterium]
MMKISEIRGKLKFNKVILICIAVVVALGTMGVGYARGFHNPKDKWLPVSTSTVLTEGCDTCFDWTASNDDGISGNIDPGD